MARTVRKTLPMTPKTTIKCDPEILAGTPVFKGTRVPARILFEYLADGLSLDYFLETFPTVEHQQVVALLRRSAHLFEHELATPECSFNQH